MATEEQPANNSLTLQPDGAAAYPERPAQLGGPAPAAPRPGAPEDYIILSDGREAYIRAGLGKDIREARRIADGDNSKMQSALVAVCTTVDGRQLFIEELDEFPMKDALAIEGRFNEKNVS